MGRKATSEISSYTPEYYRQYYHAHNEIITCECGHSIKKYGIYLHRKSKGHLNKMELARLNELVANLPKEIPLGENNNIN